MLMIYYQFLYDNAQVKYATLKDYANYLKLFENYQKLFYDICHFLVSFFSFIYYLLS
jgi:hypothetical protein